MHKYIFFTHSSADGYPGYWFHFLTIANSAALNMDVQISLTYADLESFVYIPKGGTYGNSLEINLGKI